MPFTNVSMTPKNRVLDTAGAEEQAQTHIREVEKIRRDHNLGETKSAEELGEQKNPSSKKSKTSGDGHTKNQSTAKDVNANMVPENALPMGKNAANVKGQATLLSSAVVGSHSKGPSKEQQETGPKRNFTKQLQTQKVAKQNSQSMTPMRSQYKLTLWKQRLKKQSLPRLISPRNCPNTPKVYLDEDQSPDVLYATVELELPNGSTKKLKGKVYTGAQVNLMNYMTFRELFGDDTENLLHNSQVKLTGYRGKRFKNHGKFRIDCVRHNDVVGRRVEFFVSDYGSKLLAPKFTRTMKIIKIMCEEEKDCKDCHGPYDVSEVKDSTKEEKQESSVNTPEHSLKVEKPFEIRNTAQVIKDAHDVFEGIGKLKGYQCQIEIDDKIPPVVSRRYNVGASEKELRLDGRH